MIKIGYCAQNFTAITKVNAEVFQVLIVQLGKDPEINADFSKNTGRTRTCRAFRATLQSPA